jgi:hypothetical protein
MLWCNIKRENARAEERYEEFFSPIGSVSSQDFYTMLKMQNIDITDELIKGVVTVMRELRITTFEEVFAMPFIHYMRILDTLRYEAEMIKKNMSKGKRGR